MLSFSSISEEAISASPDASGSSAAVGTAFGFATVFGASANIAVEFLAILRGMTNEPVSAIGIMANSPISLTGSFV